MRKKKLKLIPVIITLVIVIALILIFVFLYFRNKPNSDYINEKMILNFENRINDLEEYSYEDTIAVGWLQVQGTNIDFPVLFVSAASKEIDFSYAWRSPNYITGENREVIIGHNLINVSSNPIYDKTNLMDFESLMNFTYSSFAEENQYIKYTKDGEESLYVIYAVGFYDYEYDSAESFDTKEEVKKYIKMVKNNSIYDYSVDVNSDDEIITLKTCTRYFGVNEKQQFVVDARKVRNDEEIVKYQVKKNKNYKELKINDLEVN